MREKAFPIFITLLGVATLYTFYAVWRPPIAQTTISSTHPPKINPMPSQVEHASVSIEPELLHVEPTQAKSKPLKNRQNPEYIVEQTAAQTQEVYDALLPEAYEEVLAKAEEGFATVERYADAEASKLIDDKALQEEVVQTEEP